LVIYSKKISFPQNFRRLFLVISSIFYISTIQNAAGTTAQPFLHHSFSKFTSFHPSFHSCTSKFTTTTAQMHKITFYNCRNCHQLHVKIWPAMQFGIIILTLSFQVSATLTWK